jgi:hypothetical protein
LSGDRVIVFVSGQAGPIMITDPANRADTMPPGEIKYRRAKIKLVCSKDESENPTG